MAIDPKIPTVTIYNNLETFFKFLDRSNDPQVIEKRMYRGDRGIFWLGSKKLLIVTKPVPDAEAICRRWNYIDTLIATPRHTTYQLNYDILHDPALLEQIKEYAGPSKTVQLVPYATTREFFKLANHLQNRLGLTVLLPESPLPQNLWLRDYADTKSGFRSLVSQWLPDDYPVPLGFVCRDIRQAANAVDWFRQRNVGTVVKADSGESGLGHKVFPALTLSMDEIKAELASDSFLRDDLIIVDQLIESALQLSPSLELFVPRDGAPQVTYVSSQLFEEFGRFAGVLLSKNLVRTSWYARFEELGLRIAGKLQDAGYVGHFDIDAIVADDGQLHLLELNARRTGGTYVHEFAKLNFGEDYLDHVALLCNNSIKCGEIHRLDELMMHLDDLLFPIAGEDRGVVITVTSSLPFGEFGCILVASNEQELLSLKQEMLLHLESSCAQKIHE